MDLGKSLSAVILVKQRRLFIYLGKEKTATNLGPFSVSVFHSKVRRTTNQVMTIHFMMLMTNGTKTLK
jgi:hypothetical protein